MMLTVFNLIPKWVWAALVAALSATSCKLHWDKNGLVVDIEKAKTEIAQAKTKLADLRTEHLTLVAKAETDYSTAVQSHRKTELNLQVAMDTERRKFNETSIALAAARDDLRLRYLSSETGAALAAAATKSSSVYGLTSPGQAPTVSTGAELPNPVGGLIDEATRADTIRWALIGCYKAYDEASKPVNTEPKK